MDPDLLGIAGRAPFAALVLEIATGQARGLKAHDQFLFLGIDRDHRLLGGPWRPLAALGGQGGADRVVEVTELGIAIGMALAVAGLAVGWQAEVRLLQHFAHCRMPTVV